MPTEPPGRSPGRSGVPKQAYRVKEAMQALGLSRSKIYDADAHPPPTVGQVSAYDLTCRSAYCLTCRLAGGLAG